MTGPVILVCGRVSGALMLADNLTGPCGVCGVVVQYRPHAPKNRILRCVECTLEMIEPDDEVFTTPQMIKDAAMYFRRKKS